MRRMTKILRSIVILLAILIALTIQPCLAFTALPQYKSLPNLTYAYYTYDNASHLVKLTNRYRSSPYVYDNIYTYDKVGNRLTASSLRGGEADEAIYTYDNIYQLINAAYPDSSFTTYNYDSLGNRTSTINGGTIPYVSNELNQYTSVDGISYSYDDTGNLVSDGANTYTYDSENRLTHAVIASPQGEAIYTYDAFGRRVTKDNGRGTITQYIYDGDQIICEYDDSGALAAKYIYGAGIDEPVRMEKGGTSYYYHFDGLGSVIALSDTSGNLIESYSYDVYGKPNTSSTLGNHFLFTGREYDSEIELYYYRERYYDPEIGRFLQTDQWLNPIDDPISLVNKYLYCFNNPINWVDPYGLRSDKATASFRWWDVTSKILPGTNYGGITKSGPGEPTSDLDRAFKKHDELLRGSGSRFWNLSSKEVKRAHKELFKDWSNYIIEKVKNIIKKD